MAHPRLIPLRTPLVLGATVVALAASAMPAYAGGDDCGGSAPEAGDSSVRHLLGESDCPPAPAPVRPAPVQPQPTPVRPTPVQPQPAPAPVVRAPVQRQTRPQPTTQQPVQSRVTPVQTHQAVPQQTFVARTVPSGGVQAGAGGTALPRTTRQLPAIAIAALLLGLLSLGSGMRALHLKPRL